MPPLHLLPIREQIFWLALLVAICLSPLVCLLFMK